MKVRLFWVVAWVLSFVACGGTSSVQPPPPEPPGIARVVLLTDKGVVFTGKALPGQKLVAQVIDSAGHVVPPSDTSVKLTAQASPGWTVKADTVIAPATEGYGNVTITATRADPSSAVSDGAVVAATFDLSLLKLTGSSIMCRVDVAAYLADAGGDWAHYQGPKSPPTPTRPQGDFVDSLHLDGITIDSVNYAGSGDWRLTAGDWNLFGLAYWHLTTKTYYLMNPPDNVFTFSGSADGVDGALTLVKQVPDSFTVSALGDTKGTVSYATGRKGLVPSYTFDGALFCSVANDAAHPGPTDQITLTAK